MLRLAMLASARGAGLRRVAHVSTAFVAGRHSGTFGEEDFSRGQGFNNSYERSKWEAERLVRRHDGLLPVQVFRPSIVVGDELTGWTSSFNVIYTPLRAYARGLLPAVPARRSAPVDVVPVGHVARAILALGDAGTGRTWQLAAGPAASTVGELIDQAAGLLGRPPARALQPGPVPPRGPSAAEAEGLPGAAPLARAGRGLLPVLRDDGALRHQRDPRRTGRRRRGGAATALHLPAPPARLRRAGGVGEASPLP